MGNGVQEALQVTSGHRATCRRVGSVECVAANEHHELLLLPKATHIVIDPDVAGGLFAHELEFIGRNFRLPPATDSKADPRP